MTAIRVFLSYSHESEEHSSDVLALANRLRGDGIDARLDVYEPAPAEGWPRWVERQIEEADFVLCVCSKRYKANFEGVNEGKLGLGVNQEGFTILQDLYEAGNRSKKYIPVFFPKPGSYVWDCLPNVLRAFTRHDLPDDYDSLFRRLTNQPLVIVPALGPLRLLSPSDRGPVAEKSEGFKKESAIVAHIRPELHSAEQLAPSPGLFLSRLIGNARDGKLMTVWIAAAGPLDYFLDSVRVRHNLGRGLGGGALPVALLPDAEYHITYQTNSDGIYPLNPALMVGPSSRSWAWFTITLTRDKVPVNTEEWATRWIHYRNSENEFGTLVLGPVDPDIARLAKILKTEVLHTAPNFIRDDSTSMVVTPQGLQRGMEQSSLPRAHYATVRVGSRVIGGASVESDRRKAASALALRADLNQQLSDPELQDELTDWLMGRSYIAADVVGNLGTPWAAEQLLSLLGKDRIESAVSGLIVRHLVCGDDLLTNVLKRTDLPLERSKIEEALQALLIRPVAGFDELLTTLIDRKLLSEYQVKGLSEAPASLDEPHTDNGQGPLGFDVFLTGSMNSWSADQPWKMLYSEGGVYACEARLQPGVHKAKIRGLYWSQANFGAASSFYLRPGARLDLVFGPWSSDISLQIEQEASYRFEMTGERIDRMSLHYFAR